MLGLTDAQVREAPVPPSAFTLPGLPRHMAEVERGWFRVVLAGEELPDLFRTEEDPDGEWHVTESDTWAEADAARQAEVAAARKNAAAYDLDDFSKGVGSAGRPFGPRWIHTHMIEEYARHNGHADLVRERVDGATGD